MTEYRNRILCPSCYGEEGGEEKACSHGCGPAVCVRCGETREENDEPWVCTGSEALGIAETGSTGT